MMLARWRSFCNPAIAVMLVYADPDKGNGAPVTADSRFDGTFRRCFDDPAAAALFRLGDARIRDDASPQSRCRPDLAGSNGECALVHLPNLDERTDRRSCCCIAASSFITHWRFTRCGSDRHCGCVLRS